MGAGRGRWARYCVYPVIIIAVDGPAASGKGTIARALAARFHLPHLDTGLLYRAVGVATVRTGGNPDVADGSADRKSTRLNSSHLRLSRMPSSA